MSQSSYGSHKNRNFESQSHQGGSTSELRKEEEDEKLQLLMMTENNQICATNDSVGIAKNGILNRGMPVLSTVPIKDINGVCKPHRTVIIDEKEIDAHSPECDEESQSFAS